MNTVMELEPVYDQAEYVRIDPNLLNPAIIDQTIAFYEKSFEKPAVTLSSKKIAAYLTASTVSLGQNLDVLL